MPNNFGITDMLSNFANKLRDKMSKPAETPQPANTALQIETPNQADMLGQRPKFTRVENKDEFKATVNPMSALLVAWGRSAQDKNNTEVMNEKAALEEYGQRLKKALDADLYKDRANIDVMKETISPNDASERQARADNSLSQMFNSWSNGVEGQQRQELAEQKLAQKSAGGSGSGKGYNTSTAQDAINRAYYADKGIEYDPKDKSFFPDVDITDLSPSAKTLYNDILISKTGKRAGTVAIPKSPAAPKVDPNADLRRQKMEADLKRKNQIIEKGNKPSGSSDAEKRDNAVKKIKNEIEAARDVAVEMKAEKEGTLPPNWNSMTPEERVKERERRRKK